MLFLSTRTHSFTDGRKQTGCQLIFYPCCLLCDSFQCSICRYLCSYLIMAGFHVVVIPFEIVVREKSSCCCKVKYISYTTAGSCNWSRLRVRSTRIINQGDFDISSLLLAPSVQVSSWLSAEAQWEDVCGYRRVHNHLPLFSALP